MLNYSPKLKNPCLAAETLRILLDGDERWRLRLVGRPAQSYSWVWSDPAERKYYGQFEEFIASAGLGPYILREDWTDDPPRVVRRCRFHPVVQRFRG